MGRILRVVKIADALHLTTYCYFKVEITDVTKLFCVPTCSPATYFVDYFTLKVEGRRLLRNVGNFVRDSLISIFFFAPRVCTLTENFRTPDKFLGLKCEAIALCMSPFYLFSFATARVPVQNKQGDKEVSVHLIITVQKFAKLFLKVSATYHDNFIRIRGNRWRSCESSVNKCLETGGGHFEHNL
jgi:hypothetical protein